MVRRAMGRIRRMELINRMERGTRVWGFRLQN